MRIKQYYLISAFLVIVGAAAAIAANDTIGVTAGSGKTANLLKFGSNDVISEVGICDATTENQCASVSAGGAVKVDGSGVTQPVSNAGTFATQSTLTAETTKVIGTTRTLGNAGAITDFAGQNASSPANAWLMGAQFNTTPTTITNGNVSPLQLDASGNLLVNIKAGAGSGGTALADNSAFTQSTTSETPMGCLFITSYTAATSGRSTIPQCDSTGHLLSATTSWAGGVLGAMANYGTSPGAVLVPGVNASVTASALPTGAATAALQGTNTATTVHTCSTGGFSELGCLGQIDDDIKSPIPAGTSHVGTVGVAPYADGAVPITATATGTTAATTATLAASAGGLKTYICGFSIRANATAAVTNNATVTGVVTATMNFTQWTAPLASGLGVTEMVFSPCVPSSAANTAINVVSGAPGTGGTVSVSAWGYQL